MLRFTKTLIIINLLISFFISTQCDRSIPDIESFPKVDTHVHINTTRPAFISSAEKINFRLLTIATSSSRKEEIQQQLKFATHQIKQHPGRVQFATTFSMENFSDPDWTDKTIEKLSRDFGSGAIAVKVWKDIGLVFRDENGEFIQIDNPKFDPVFDFIAPENKTLIAHIGEPLNSWLPVDSMTVYNDRNYFRNHPEYHMYLHPEYPSHKEIIAARHQMLEKHPDLRVVGAHLGSLEYDVDVLAERLDKYPNFAVDMAARIPHFQLQDRANVRTFIRKYQNRLVYATDIGVSPSTSDESVQEKTERVWREDWGYFSTDHILNSDKVTGEFQGLDLNRKVLRKIYSRNVNRWFPGFSS